MFGRKHHKIIEHQMEGGLLRVGGGGRNGVIKNVEIKGHPNILVYISWACEKSKIRDKQKNEKQCASSLIVLFCHLGIMSYLALKHNTMEVFVV